MDSGSSDSKKAPHLVFILVDDLGFNDFSYRSSDLSHVWPSVNSLLNESIKVEHYYTQPLCTPTRGAFMTGRYPARLGLQHGVIAGYQDYGLPLDEVTLADKLREVGYGTYIVGKWHLGLYTFNATPPSRGFDQFYGYYNGMEDYLTHSIQGYLDLHHQTGPGPDNHTMINTLDGTYSTGIFTQRLMDMIQKHKLNQPHKPGFFYFPLQNVHEPLESPGAPYDEPCADIPNSDRRTFCAMAAAADSAIGNITRMVAQLFEGEDYLVVISGDNGGMPMSAGNNFPLRGHKAELWEGGVRNNAIVWGSLVPHASEGTTFSDGFVHITDWHVTLAKLGGADVTGKGPLDGHDIWPSLITGAASPRTEFLVNYDPCSGHGECSGIEWAYRYGDWKLIVGAANDTWYPVPDSADDVDGTAALRISSSGVQSDSTSGNVWFEKQAPIRRASNEATVADDGPSAECVTAVKKVCPNGTLDCNGCIERNWKGSLESICAGYSSTAAGLEAWMCYGAPLVWLFNITADPTESNNLISSNPEVVSLIQDKVDAIINGNDYMPPCNIPGGACNSDDPDAAAVLYAQGGWYPWV